MVIGNQAFPILTTQDFAAIQVSLSGPRLGRYVQGSKGDCQLAVELYCWNLRLSKTLQTFLHYWEICLRNRLNEYFSSKYGLDWPYDHVFLRNLTDSDYYKIMDVIDRQKNMYRFSQVPTPRIISDLSAGFWVSQLSSAYEYSYNWSHNLALIFPHSQNLFRKQIHHDFDRLLKTRNRIAHHEPIYYKKPKYIYDMAKLYVGFMCQISFKIGNSECIFEKCWHDYLIWMSAHKLSLG